ncbi:hypothetical protein BKI52_43940 [marine bacterium AO1-C]|nr:hypothetical protein BKI52_43940 [marine bacterium AO1-C]
MIECTLTDCINQDPQKQAILAALKQLEITQKGFGSFFIAAGFLRNMYWDYAHAFSSPTPLSDVDVVYFHPAASEKTQDMILENELVELLPNIPWSVKNQARMHVKSGHTPYTSLEDALSNWVETATAIGVRVASKQHLEFIAPWGFQDVEDLILRPTPFFEQKLPVFQQRIESKQWLEKWPKLRVVWPKD